eukprot:1138156-Pelagomonas_calceolata.AAC.7
MSTARLHGQQPASCHASSTSSVAQHMPERGFFAPQQHEAAFGAGRIAWYEAGPFSRPWKK